MGVQGLFFRIIQITFWFQFLVCVTNFWRVFQRDQDEFLKTQEDFSSPQNPLSVFTHLSWFWFSRWIFETHFSEIRLSIFAKIFDQAHLLFLRDYEIRGLDTLRIYCIK